MLSKICAALLAVVLTVSPALAAVENLDEVMARKARQNSSTFYSGEAAETYIWQPQTLQYIDTTTGHEVWRVTNTPSVKKIYHDDISLSPWSADGARLAYAVKYSDALGVNTSAYAGEDTYEGWFVGNTDGSKLRPIVTGPARINEHVGWFPWNPAQPDIYYSFGRTRLNAGAEEDTLYKGSVSDIGFSSAELLDFENSLQMELPRNALSPDGQRASTKEFYNATSYTLWPVSIGADSAAKIDADGHALNRPHDTNYWGDTPSTWATFHSGEMYLTSDTSGYWIWAMPSGSHTWWKFSLSGTAADGGSEHTVDRSAPYDFGETIPINSAYSTLNNPWPGTEYWSHFAIDRWGRLALFSDVEVSPISPGVEDTATHSIIRSAYGAGGVQHNDWHGWTDWFVSSFGPVGADYTEDFVYTAYYDSNAHTPVAKTHTLYNNSGTYAGADYEYNAIPRPSQSPDGTKIAFHSTFTQTKTGSYDDKPDLFWAVAYYPHPPEITSVTGSGTYTIRFDWRTDQTTSRGYTQRGWPDEATDDPPPPRETKAFRLWRSTDSSTWTPISTVDAEIFSRYNFSAGAWTGNNYWTITDTPGAGTFYYAVTAIEHSGLESRVLSNVFSTGGAQTAAYPADPKAGTGVTATYQPTAKRHYNIYAEDVTTPAATQQNRIASVPIAAAAEYVDWLGNTDGTTKYVVTAVDTQGNESSALDVTFAETATDGQYLVEWAGEGETPAAGAASLSGPQGAGLGGAGSVTIQ